MVSPMHQALAPDCSSNLGPGVSDESAGGIRMSEEQIAHDLDFKRGAISKLARARAETVHFQTAMLVDGLRALEQAGSGPELRTAAENVRIRAELTLRLLIEVMSYGAQLAGIGTGHEVLEAVHSGELLQL